MNCSRARISLAVSVALAAMFAVPAQAQQGNAPQGNSQSLERIEVTGSRIKRVDTETASPLQVFTREEIERTGSRTVNEVLQTISGAGYAADDRITNGFAPGAGSLNLRGLGFNSTLVLVNGRRMPTYPFAQQFGTSQGFQDLNAIPLGAVERIEILKDGASAIYGADAVAGVVNIILRKDYKGLEATARFGITGEGDGNQSELGLLYGFGDLATNRFNVLIGANFLKRDEIFSRDRSYAGTEDLRTRGVPNDRRSAYGFPNTWEDSVTGDLAYPSGCGPTSQRGGSSIRGGFCRYDRATFGGLLPEAERGGVYGKLNFAVTSDLTAFVEGMYSRNKYYSTGFPAPTTDDIGLGSALVPAGNPSNPFPNAAFVYHRFQDIGTRDDTGTANTSRILLGLSGTNFAGWDWEAAFNTNKIEVDQTGKNQVLNTRAFCVTNPAGAAALGNNPTALAALIADPVQREYIRRELTSCNTSVGLYNYRNPFANTQAMRDYIRHDAKRQGDSTLDGFDVRASRELMNLSGGPLALAIGAETRREEVSDTPDIQTASGNTLGLSASAATGSRRVSAAYAELNAPLFKGFELNGALRYDKYSGDSGDDGATSPKVSFKWQTAANFAIRGSWSKAFRAPSLFETTPATQTAFTFGIQDPVLCPVFDANNQNCSLDIRRIQRGNPNLQPEKSNAYNFGIIFEPTRDSNISFDLWRIDRKNEIGQFADQQLVDLFPNNPQIVQRNAGGQIVSLTVQPVQLQATNAYGFDIDGGLRTSMGEWGRLSSRVTASYLASFRQTVLNDNLVFEPIQFAGTYNLPRWRANWDFTWNRGAWEASLTGYIIGAYGALNTPPEKIEQQTIWGLGGAYTGFKNLTLRANIANLFDEHPPFSNESSASNAGYNPSLSDPRGRFFSIGATYKFF
jgi:iron complex outermembrane receptor protein